MGISAVVTLSPPRMASFTSAVARSSTALESPEGPTPLQSKRSRRGATSEPAWTRDASEGSTARKAAASMCVAV